MYTLLRPLLFSLDAETAHHLTLESLQLAARTGALRRCIASVAPAPRKVMGIDFPNPVGLAAGLDKNGDYIDALAALGFGFVGRGVVHRAMVARDCDRFKRGRAGRERRVWRFA